MTRVLDTLEEKMYIDTEDLSNLLQNYKMKGNWENAKLVDALIDEIRGLPLFCISAKIQVLK